MSTTPAGGRSLHNSLRLLTDARRAYQHSGDADRRLANQAFYTRLDITDDEQLRPKLANQAFYTRLDITDDEQLRPKLAEPFATIFREALDHGDEGKEAKREHTTSSDVACSHKTLLGGRWRTPITCAAARRAAGSLVGTGKPGL